jgi:hypothetical protein
MASGRLLLELAGVSEGKQTALRIRSYQFVLLRRILSRSFTKRFASFASETDIIRLIMNFPSFGRGLSGFSNNLQGSPHAVVHNFIGQHMSSYFSPGKSRLLLSLCSELQGGAH